MTTALATPGAPILLLSVAAVLIAVGGVVYLVTQRQLLTGVVRLPNTSQLGGRVALGHMAAIPLVLIVVVGVLAIGLDGMGLWLGLALALALYLYLGVVVPRRPIVQADKARKKLRLLTPNFVGYLRIGLASKESPASLLSRYSRDQINPRMAPMREVVSEALTIMERRQERPFAALWEVAVAKEVQELADICAALAQAEVQGSDVQQTLIAQEKTLEQILKDEFRALIARRTMYMTALVAVALVIGVPLNLLFTITGGGTLLFGN